MGYGAALTAHRLPDPSLPWSRGQRLVPGRRLRDVLDRRRHRAHRRVRVLPGLHHPGQRLRATIAGSFAPWRVRHRSSSTIRSGGSTALSGDLRCGVAWNTLFLGMLVGVGTTALGLAFALIATRTSFRYKSSCAS